RGCAERERSGVESAESHRSRARYRLCAGAGGFTRSREPHAELRIENGNRRDAKMERRGIHAAVAGRDPDVRRGEGTSGCVVEEGGAFLAGEFARMVN